MRSLARRTAAEHGGSLRCEAMATGSRIVLDLPVAHVPAPAAEAVSP